MGPMADNVNLKRTSQIISSFLAKSSVAADELPDLIESVSRALEGKPEEVVPELHPAVPRSKSVTSDFIVCLEDGKKYRSLKRHLGTVYNMTPEQYRTKWGLAADYPMVAPGYAKMRSQLARDMGLGQMAAKGKEAVQKALPPPEKAAPKAPVKAKAAAKAAPKAAAPKAVAKAPVKAKASAKAKATPAPKVTRTVVKSSAVPKATPKAAAKTAKGTVKAAPSKKKK